MRDALNREGLTFEEWVCAAGLAVIDYDGVKPYTYSYTAYRPKPPQEWEKGSVLLLFGTSRAPEGIPYRRKITYYPPWVRKAWKEGEDPTEYMAMGMTLNRRRST